MAKVTVQIEDWELLDMLLERCEAWGTTSNNKDLFEKMYQNYIDSGVFEGIELNIRNIVDNDAVNYCTVIHKEDSPKDFKKLLKLYKKGEYDVIAKILRNITHHILRQ